MATSPACAASRPRPSLEQGLPQAAEARRRALRPTHKLANLVGRTGVRVDVRGAGANAEGSGEVLGVGKLSPAELEERLRRPAPTRRVAWCARKEPRIERGHVVRPTYFVEGRL